MHSLMVLFLAALAVANANICFEEKAEHCVDKLLSSLVDDASEKEVCRELESSISCLRTSLDECDDDVDGNINDGIEELEKVLNDNCKKDADNSADNDEDNELKQCIEANEDYIYECVYEGTLQSMSVMMERNDEDLDENALTCLMYSMVSGCFVDRIGERCGEKAAKLADEEMRDIPEDIKEACEASTTLEAHSFQLLDVKKK